MLHGYFCLFAVNVVFMLEPNYYDFVFMLIICGISDDEVVQVGLPFLVLL